MQGEPNRGRVFDGRRPLGRASLLGATDVRAATRRPQSKIHLRMGTGEMIGVSQT
jgi:hypothetical protein